MLREAMYQTNLCQVIIGHIFLLDHRWGVHEGSAVLDTIRGSLKNSNQPLFFFFFKNLLNYVHDQGKTHAEKRHLSRLAFVSSFPNH